MVQNIERSRQASFPASAPAANAVFYRTYSRRSAGPDATRETWGQMCDRTLEGLTKLGQLSEDEAALVGQMQQQLKAMPSGRWLWVGGTDWLEKSENFSGSYNCTSTNVIDWPAFGLMMDLAMMGCGTGAVLEHKYINLIPAVRNPINVVTQGDIGTVPAEQRQEQTEVSIDGHDVYIRVGDSRSGWVSSYQTLLELSTDERFSGAVSVTVDLSNVRPAGEKLKGFGGVANPVRLPRLYDRCANILNKAQGRKLTSVECCLLIDEAAACVVAGNIRRCLPKDALVHTINGLLPIEAVQIGDFVQTPIGFRRVVNKFDQGYQNVYELQTNATAPRATLNHRQAVLADAQGSFIWKQVSELAEGDRLVHSAQVLPGAVTHLPADDSETAQGLAIPKLTPLVAWLVGFTQGDGDVVLGRDQHNQSYGRVEWAMNEAAPETTFRLRQTLDRALAEFGLTASHGATSGGAIAKSSCSSLQFAEYIHRHIKQPVVALMVPAFVLQGSVDVRAAYLAGLADSDGGSANRPPQLLTTVYGRFVRQVGAVLSSLGIAGRLSVVVPGEETWQPKYNLAIPALKGRYNAIIAPHSVKGKLRQALKAHAFTVPANLMLEEYTYGDMQEAGGEEAPRADSNYECYIADSEMDLPIPVTFKGLSSYDHVQTFDIEVEESHCFFCDGYLTHNSAGMRQFSSDDEQAAQAKENLWGQDADGNWRIDPERDVLRMANHTRVFHHKPSLEECQAAVRKQYYSGEGAIQWAGEAIARANVDLVRSPEEKSEFLQRYGQSSEAAQEYLKELAVGQGINPPNPYELKHRAERYGLNPCGEIIGADFHCNLAEVHLNQLNPSNPDEQDAAFKAGALSVAALLNHRFNEDRYRRSREMDPIVGVSFTGLFDFFVHALGVEWLQWWEAGRPDTMTGLKFKQQEQDYLTRWRDVVHSTVWDYCDRHGIKRPNRCTTVQPAGTKSLLTGASSGWHPPKAQRFIRRITFGKGDPVAMACIDYGYSVVPAQSDKDEQGRLLDDPFDPRCTEWLVEIPTEVSWANLPGADRIDISQFSALAQFDFYSQVQQHYTTHNTSATIELREPEVEPLAEAIYRAIETDAGYMSAALLARFDDHQTFPRLPFEPIDKATYDQLTQAVVERRGVNDFHKALTRYDLGDRMEAGPAGCDSDKCMMPEARPDV